MGKKRTAKKIEIVAIPPSAGELVSDDEKIALLAYSYWEERGRPDGSSQEDWFRAERKIADPLANSKRG